MKYHQEDMMRDVRVELGYNPDNMALIEADDIETLRLDEMIRRQVIPSACQVLCTAPVERIDTCRPLRGTLAWAEQEGTGMAFMVLPDDFLRLISVSMTNWRRPAKIIAESDPLYPLQSSPFPGVRGNPDRPVAAIVRYPAALVVELYAATGGVEAKLQRALYVAAPRFNSEGYIDLPAPLYHDIIRQIAETVRTVV